MVHPKARLAEQPIEFGRLISHDELKPLLASHVTAVQMMLRGARAAGIHTMSSKNTHGKVQITHVHLGELICYCPGKFKRYVVEQHEAHVENKFLEEHDEKVRELSRLVIELEEKQRSGTFDKKVQQQIIPLVLALERSAKEVKTPLPNAVVKARKRYEDLIGKTYGPKVV